jgi:hypothetical protein
MGNVSPEAQAEWINSPKIFVGIEFRDAFKNRLVAGLQRDVNREPLTNSTTTRSRAISRDNRRTWCDDQRACVFSFRERASNQVAVARQNRNNRRLAGGARLPESVGSPV